MAKELNTARELIRIALASAADSLAVSHSATTLHLKCSTEKREVKYVLGPYRLYLWWPVRRFLRAAKSYLVDHLSNRWVHTFL